jgi:hypothetical protein
MKHYNICCDHCVWCGNPVPTLPPCSEWKTCLDTDYGLFKPNAICKVKAWFKKVILRQHNDTEEA